MYMLVARHFFAFIFSFLIALHSIPIIITVAKKLGILDVPDGKIKKHDAPVPYFGGLAIFIAFISTLALVYPFENKVLWLLLGSTMLLFTGLIDDLKALQPGQKFFWQILAVLCFLKGGISLKTTFLSSLPNLFFSAFWMLTIINAFNLIDVMDGLASLVAIIATTTLFIIALCFQQYSLSLLLLTFLGPLFAFFIYNKPPARIYLGDTGALFIGGFLAAVPMLFNWSAQSFTAYYAPIIILGVPTIEVISLVIIRTWIGIPFYKGSPHHFSIFLQKKGWPKPLVLLFTALASIMLSALAICYLFDIISGCMLTIGLTIFLSAWSVIIFSFQRCS